MGGIKFKKIYSCENTLQCKEYERSHTLPLSIVLNNAVYSVVKKDKK